MLNIFVIDFINVALVTFIIGIWGIFVVRKNIIIVLVSIELLLFAVNLLFVIFSVYLDDLVGQLFALFILTIAAAESAIGLALLVNYYRIFGIINTDSLSHLKG